MSTVKLFFQILFLIPFSLLFLGVIIFIPANTIEWLEGWIFSILIMLFAIMPFIYLMIKDPATLERRRKLSGSTKDKIFLMLFGIAFLLIPILPGLDFQYKWSPLPFTIEVVSFLGFNFQYKWSPVVSAIEVIGFLGLIVSCSIYFLVMRANTFASKGVTIHEAHRVITTGPYALVRHPMYVAFILIGFSIPLSLGSLVALIPALLVPVFVVFRIRYEEELLKKELSDYKEYMKKVPYRLIPKIW
ncbi:MAG: methyltransferase family protein [Promethearchaeota archaeon]